MIANKSKASMLRQIKKGAQRRLLHLSAGKEGQVSNQFKEDLILIIDFLEINKREIIAILKEK
ncbi:MAG: hypothetical protein ACXVP0_12350 [Bacteroidia bacterium]